MVLALYGASHQQIMATLNSAITFARAIAQTDSNGLTDTNAIVYANEGLIDYRRQLQAAGVDASQTQEAYMDATVATSGNGSTFLYPTDMFRLKTIEANYTDTDATNYKPVTQIDVSNLAGSGSFSWLRTNADPNSPQFDDRGDQFEIFPAFTSSHNLTRAVRIFYFLEATEYTAIGDTIAYPESLDYRILGFRIASNYKKSLSDFVAATAFDVEYQQRINKITNSLAVGSQQPIQAIPLQITGWGL